jgi:anti-anti-sigma regulatory factor
MTSVLTLPERLDHDAAKELHGALLMHRGMDLTVDGGQVRSAGGLSAQLLLAAARDWKQSAAKFQLSASLALQDDLERLGVFDEINRGEAQK